jgi:hypothetical protein
MEDLGLVVLLLSLDLFILHPINHYRPLQVFSLGRGQQEIRLN